MPKDHLNCSEACAKSLPEPPGENECCFGCLQEAQKRISPTGSVQLKVAKSSRKHASSNG